MNDSLARLASLYLILKPQQHRAVLFLFVSIEVQVGDCGCKLLNKRAQF